MSGKKVTLSNTSLIHLTELERLVLQKIALAKLQALELGVSIHIPKGKLELFFHKAMVGWLPGWRIFHEPFSYSQSVKN